MNKTGNSIPQRSDLALSSEVLYHLWREALTALHGLRTALGIAASGQSDHFHAIFGRDSLWTLQFALEACRFQDEGLETALDIPDYRAWLHDLAASVLRGLAHLQGRVVNDENEEQPGRIIHEYWDPVPVGHTLAGWPVPEGRYYGAFDSTFLFLTTLHTVHTVFDDAELLDELWPPAQAAFHWMLDWSDLDEDGLVEYKKRNPHGIGLNNQVWKDSGEAIRMPDHRRMKHPVAWIEVQGYAWAAYHAYYELAMKRGELEPSLGAAIQRRMDRLKDGLSRYWFDEDSAPFLAMALDADKQAIQVISSNPGHLLWSGCLEPAEAQPICTRLLLPDMLTPWGLRTLSTTAYYYDPLSYHGGTVWPFDNCVVALGLSRYGFEQEALSLAHAVLQALVAFQTPVELYTVQPASSVRSHHLAGDWFLADYRRSTKVQAWTAAAMLYFTALLMREGR